MICPMESGSFQKNHQENHRLRIIRTNKKKKKYLDKKSMVLRND